MPAIALPGRNRQAPIGSDTAPECHDIPQGREAHLTVRSAFPGAAFGGGIGGGAKGASNAPLVRDKLAARADGHYTCQGGCIDVLREGSGIDEDVKAGSRHGGCQAFSANPPRTLGITTRYKF